MAEPELGPAPGPAAGPGPVSAEAVLRELALFELHCQGEDVPARLLELCGSHGLDPVALANELLAFVTSRDLEPQLSADVLDAFEHEVLTRRSRVPRRRDGPHDLRSLQRLLGEEEEEEEEEEELLDAYTTPSKGPQKRSASSPETPRPKRTPSSRSPRGLLSPSGSSPSTAPSPKYVARSGRGEVVASFGVPPPEPAWSGVGGHGCTLQLFGAPQDNLTQSYKFMFQKPLDVREALLWRMEELGEALRSHYGLDDFAPLSLPAQEPVTVLGQIGCDSAGKLNARSVLLEADGHRIPLDLSELPEFSLFPGQVVALEGTNSSGRQLVVTKLYEGVPLPFYEPPEPAPDPPEAQLVLVACGPFTPAGSLGYQPLGDLLQEVARLRPALCVLLGPFVDARHEEVESCRLPVAPGDIFGRCLRELLEGTRSAGSRLVLVPSLRDLHHDHVYPQPPFACPELPREDRERLLLAPEPCVLELDGVVLALSSTDLLRHLSAEELSSPGLPDRLGRLLRHLLTQRSFYPLYPPAAEVPLEQPHCSAFARLPVTPDVLITPSELHYFLKDVLGCLCLNPGRLTKGAGGGTYGRLLLQRQPPAGDQRRSPCLAAQVVKI